MKAKCSNASHLLGGGGERERERLLFHYTMIMSFVAILSMIGFIPSLRLTDHNDLVRARLRLSKHFSHLYTSIGLEYEDPNQGSIQDFFSEGGANPVPTKTDPTAIAASPRTISEEVEHASNGM